MANKNRNRAQFASKVPTVLEKQKGIVQVVHADLYDSELKPVQNI